MVNTLDNETIVALATPPGRGGVAIIRVSGNLSRSIALSLLKKDLKAREVTFSNFYNSKNEIIDQGIALLFESPHSFTGEDVLELHSHGSPVITDWLIEIILSFGAKLARPGEFSERAFLNNKLDLTAAEAIADLIDSSSRESAKCALRSLQGEFSRNINILVEQLSTIRVLVESAIDFSEEEIDFADKSEIIDRLMTLIVELETVIELAAEGSRICEGVKIVISGKPNAGKSSLLNCLSGRNAAIVTTVPGTTRDVLRENILLEGLSIELIDTAGLRTNTQDEIEKEGIRRAREALELADLVLSVHDASSIKSPLVSSSANMIIVYNKIDLTDHEVGIDKDEHGRPIIFMSAKKGDGVNLLVKEIHRLVRKQPRSGAFSARRRHLEALSQAKTSLQNAIKQLTANQGLDCAAEELRLAQINLGEITGIVSSDDLLGKIFSTFCVGK